MNILCKEGGFVGEICERGRFRSPSRQTLLRGTLVQNEEGLATMLHCIVCMYIFDETAINCHIIFSFLYIPIRISSDRQLYGTSNSL